METTRLGKKGQVSIPRIVLEKLGLEAETLLLVEPLPDGSILLRPAGVYPMELYSDARVAEILAEDEMTEDEAGRLRKKLGRS
jgi:AbrB family looped-hinge helix DNA binding protein